MDDLINNYFLLRKLAQRLEIDLAGTQLAEAWLIGKQQVVFNLKNKNNDIFLNLFFLPDKVLISMPTEFSWPIKNVKPVFREATGKQVRQVQVNENDRSFNILMGKKTVLVFKLYGRHANIILAADGEVTELLRPKLQRDWEIKPYQMHHPVEIEDGILEAMMARPLTHDTIISLNPAYTSDFALALEKGSFLQLPAAVQWHKLMEFESYLQNPKFYLLECEAKRIDDPGLRISFFPLDKPIWEKTDIVEALNSYTSEYLHRYRMLTTRNDLLKRRQGKKRKLERQLATGNKELVRLQLRRNYKELADLLMANLHQIKNGAEKAEVFDFYEEKDLIIPLKRELSVQKNAEKLYQKAKRQHIEVEKLQGNISRLHEELEETEEEIIQINKIEDYRQLKKLDKQGDQKEKALAPSLSYKEFSLLKYKILVGKSGKNNDELTFKVAAKNDIWLHAKDFAGSHVVIKTKGEPVPQPVLEGAAQLAAWHSKGRNHGLCPVSYTEKKYVRKPKGMAPGKVIVERERVVLVKPSADPGELPD